MKTITATQFKTHFSNIVAQAQSGETIAVTYGKKKKIVGYFVAKKTKAPKRRLGLLEGKAKFTFMPNFKNE